MTPRDRVHAALRREPVDRVPIFMWFHPDTACRLADLLEIPPGGVSLAMGDDVRQTWVANNHAMEGITHERDGDRTTSDYWFAADPELLNVMVQYAGPYGVEYRLKKLARWAYWDRGAPRP